MLTKNDVVVYKSGKTGIGDYEVVIGEKVYSMTIQDEDKVFFDYAGKFRDMYSENFDRKLDTIPKDLLRSVCRILKRINKLKITEV